jgi:hypothetical protein
MIGKSPMNTGLALDLASRVVGELRGHEQRGTVGEVLLLALLDRGLDLVEARSENESDMVPEKSSMGLISSRISASPLRACGSSAHPVGPRLVADQPVERLGLDREEVGHLKVFVIRPNEIRRGACALDE